MKSIKPTFIIILLLFTFSTLTGQIDLEKGWKHWENGDIHDAQSVTEEILKNEPANNEALHLKTLCLYVQGKYKESIETFSLIDKTYDEHEKLVKSIIEAYFHLNEPDNAYKLAKKFNMESVDYYKDRVDKPFTVNGDKTYVIPFVDDPLIPSKYMPGVSGKINGKEKHILFDTGGPFLVIGKDLAEELGIKLEHEGTGLHGPNKVKTWRNIVEKLELGDGLVFENVPVGIMESLGKLAIFGTNILEQFLSTIDYPNSRFILTPRNKKELYKDHLELISEKQETLPFYIWGDHFMIGKGSFNNIDNLNFFFDSGLLVIEMIDGKPKQASFNLSKVKMIELGFDESKLDKSDLFQTEYPLSLKGLSQENTLIFYNVKLDKDRVFGGIRIDGLISHAFLSKYSWTIDFNKQEYIFGID